YSEHIRIRSFIIRGHGVVPGTGVWRIQFLIGVDRIIWPIAGVQGIAVHVLRVALLVAHVHRIGVGLRSLRSAVQVQRAGD
ncbi:hypothetical protein IscW_ISCW010902, partial [Ixodes scapularis]